MSVLAPWTAAVLAVVGVLCLPTAAVLGVTPASDAVLDAAQVLLAAAAAIFLIYIAVGLIIDFRRA
jgi:hypothetical protein